MRPARHIASVSFAALAVLANACLEEPRTSSSSSGGKSNRGGTAGASETGGHTGGEEMRGGTDSGGRGGAPSTASGGAGGDAGAPEPSNSGAGAGGETSSPQGGAGGSGGEMLSTGGAGGDDMGEVAGAGGSGPPVVVLCPSSVVDGFASVNGLGMSTGTTGGSGTPITVTTAEELQMHASSPEPAIIVVSGTIVIPALDVTSNKTIVGADANAKIEGGIRILGTPPQAGMEVKPELMVSNVIIKNLTIDALTSNTSDEQNEDDGINVSYAHHVWIDHVDIVDAGGDDLDIGHGSDYVTVSWSTIRFERAFRRVGARIGHSDANAVEDAGRLKVTMHHNWWSDRINQRMPRVRFGDVHVYNSYYTGAFNPPLLDEYCIAAGYESRLLVQNNYFDGSRNPHVFFSFVGNNASFTEPTAEMVATDNHYVGESTLETGRQSGQGPAFEPPYPVTLEPADEALKEVIRSCARPL